VEVRVASQGAAHVEFFVHVRPRARRASVGGEHAGALEVRVRAAPSEGAANAEVLALVAAALGLRRADLELVSGASARRKRLRAHGDAAVLAARLHALAAAGGAV
jgi:uncharacterized protein (TIGR00251 family)